MSMGETPAADDPDADFITAAFAPPPTDAAGTALRERQAAAPFAIPPAASCTPPTRCSREPRCSCSRHC
ncbi:MAG: hypothetical protein U0R24_00565 [Solirubrobacterales bacterium]